MKELIALITSGLRHQHRYDYECTQKIPAIKMYREHTGLGLAEAKQAVESIISSISPGLYDKKQKEIANQAKLRAALVKCNNAYYGDNEFHNKSDKERLEMVKKAVDEALDSLK